MKILLNIKKHIQIKVISKINEQRFKDAPSIAVVNNNVKKVPGRIYRTIDFVLPGQLGFSLLSAGVFGVAFLFFNLRQQLVLSAFPWRGISQCARWTRELTFDRQPETP